MQAQIKRTVAPVREFIPAHLHTEVEALVRDYRASKVANLENRFVSEKVEQYIDLPAMNTWLDHTAPTILLRFNSATPDSMPTGVCIWPGTIAAPGLSISTTPLT